MGRPVILVIDTQPELCLLLGRLLRDLYQVADVHPENLLIDGIEKKRYDAVFLGDIQPEALKLNLIKTLKASSPDVPIIHTGPLHTQECIIKAFRAGATDVLIQPIQRKDLLVSLSRTLKPKEKNVFSRTWRRLKIWLKPDPQVLKTIDPVDVRVVSSDRKSVLTIPNRKIITPDAVVIRKRRIEAVSTLGGFLLGPFQIVLNGVLLESWPSKKGKSLLAYLLYHHREKNLRDVLMEMFWPNRNAESARNSLNGVLHGIRRTLHQVDDSQEHILFKDEGYIINPDIEIQLDHEMFLQHWRRGKRLERESGIAAALEEYTNAITLYKGDFFEDDLYEDWPSVERENIKEVYLFILDRLSSYYGSCNDYTTGITLCKKILKKDDCREDVHRRLMLFLYQTGHRDMAIRQFRKCEEALKNELGVNPSKSTLTLVDQIKQEGFRLDATSLSLGLSKN